MRHFSDLTKQRMKLRKIEFINSQYKWDLIEPYLDVNICNGSRNRTREFITFRIFKDLILSGKSLRDLAKMGYSLHLIRFMCRFAKGNIKLTKEKLMLEYPEKELDKIAKENGIAIPDMCSLRALYGIQLTSGPKRQRLKTEKPYTKEQLSLIYGSMLGDASRKGKNIVSFAHGDVQREYIIWKFQMLNGQTGKRGLVLSHNVSEKYKLDNWGWRFNTKASSDAERCVQSFYFSGKKEVPKNISEYLDPLAIAIWYMDDGNAHWKSANNVEMHFCTDGFSLESCQILIMAMKNIGIETRIRKVGVRKDKKNAYGLFILPVTRQKFVDMIRPYVLPMFHYKIDYSAYLKYREAKAEAEKAKAQESEAANAVKC